MHIRRRQLTQTETGSAMIFAVVAMVVASILAIAIFSAATSHSDRSRDDRDRVLASGPAEDGVRAYVTALSAGRIGEHTGYQFTKDALTSTVREEDASAGMCTGTSDELCLIANSASAYPEIDAALVPNAADQLTVRRRANDHEYRFWQVLAVSAPRFGVSDAQGVVSPGGALVIYIRAWQGGATEIDGRNRPVVQRAVLRPAVFSDYQLAADGQMFLGDGTQINGKVHSNGFRQSLNDQYRTLGGAITITPGVTCTPTAKFSTSAGTIDVLGGNCNRPEYLYEGIGTQVSMLSVDKTVQRMRTLCGDTEPVRVVCINSASTFQGPYEVALSGSNVTVTGQGSWSAENERVTFRDTSGSTGLVLLLDRSANLSGQLGATARATIVASNRTAVPLQEIPAIHLRNSGSIGASSDPTSALGLIADGDVVAHEDSACPVHLSAALVAQGGLLSRDPAYRGGAVPGAPLCSDSFELEGSSVAHLFHYLATVASDGTVLSGYQKRSFNWDPSLYDNPPPMFPTSGDWQVLENKVADLECFEDSAAPSLVDKPGCR